MINVFEKNDAIEKFVVHMLEETANDIVEWREIDKLSYTTIDDKDIYIHRNGEYTTMIIRVSDENINYTSEDLEKNVTDITSDDGVEMFYAVPVDTVQCGTGAMFTEKCSKILDLISEANNQCWKRNEKEKELKAFRAQKAINEYIESIKF